MADTTTPAPAAEPTDTGAAQNTTPAPAPTPQKATGSAAPSTGTTQGQPAKQPDDPFGGPGMLFLVIIALLWFWVIRGMRKQKNKEKDRDVELKGLRKGDKVVTIGRMHGTVIAVTEDTMTIKPDDKSGTTMKFDRVALLRIVNGNDKKATGDAAASEEKNTGQAKALDADSQND